MDYKEQIAKQFKERIDKGLMTIDDIPNAELKTAVQELLNGN